MKIQSFLLYVLMFSASFVFGQNDKVEYANIGSSRNPESILSVNTDTLSESSIKLVNKSTLSNYLQYLDGFYVRNFGGDYFSNLSLRGGAHRQTLVTWNGLGMMNSSFDSGLTNVTLDHVQYITLHRGGSSAKFNGALSGAIDINTKMSPQNKAIIHGEIFYGNHDLKAIVSKVKVGNENIRFRASYLRQKYEGDYEYIRNGETAKIQNGRSNMRNVNFDLESKLGKNTKLDVHVWGGRMKKNIPTTTISDTSKQYRLLDFDRVMLDFSHKFNDHIRVDVKSGQFFDLLNEYQNRKSSPNKTFEFSSANNVHLAYSYKGYDTGYIGIENRYTRADSYLFSDIKYESIYDLVGGYQYRTNDYTFHAIGRLGLDKSNLFASELIFTKPVGSNSKITAKLARDYRRPLLINRYSKKGGNPNIKPEHAYSQELKYFYDGPLFRYYAKLYHSLVTNRINKGPLSRTDLSLISENVPKVRVYGGEFYLRYQKSINDKLTGLAYSTFSVSRAMTLDAFSFYLEPSQQFLYTPIFQADIHLAVASSKSMFGIAYRWTGRSKGLFNSLDPYGLLDLRLKTKLSKDLVAVFSLNNILNKEVYNIEFNPQPRMNAQLRFIFEFIP